MNALRNKIDGIRLTAGQTYDVDPADRDAVIEAVEAAHLAHPADVADAALEILAESGLDAALAEVRRAAIAEARHVGDLHDYLTGAYIRPATKAERDESRDAGPEGVIRVAGRSCYVQE